MLFALIVALAVAVLCLIGSHLAEGRATEARMAAHFATERAHTAEMRNVDLALAADHWHTLHDRLLARQARKTGRSPSQEGEGVTALSTVPVFHPLSPEDAVRITSAVHDSRKLTPERTNG